MEYLLLGFVIPTFVKGYAAAISTPIAIAAVIALLLKVDTKKENLRREAIVLGRKFNENGLTILDKLLENFAVGDKSGMVKSLIELAGMVQKPEVFTAHINELFKIQLTKRLQDPASRTEISKLLSNAIALKKVEADAAVKDTP